MKRTATALTLVSLCLTLAADRALVAADETNVTGTPMPCGRHEEYTTCLPICPGTCENPLPGICADGPCVKGCKCKSGYYRNSDGHCVNVVACILDIIKNQLPQLKP